MNHALPLLFALNVSEVVGAIVTLAFIIFWVINQINETKKKQAEVQGQLAVEPQPQAAGAAAMAGEPVPQADPLRAQIDEFLRRAGQQQKPPQGAAPQRPPRQPAGRDEIVVLLDDSVAEPPRKRLAEKMRPLSEAVASGATPAQPAPAAPPPREPKPASPRRDAGRRPKSVAEHVAEHVGAATEEIRKEVSDLGERVKQADEQFDVQLQQKFGHELGSLRERHLDQVYDQPAAAAKLTPAAQIAALLASPDGVRQAIVLNEILRRPSDRW